LPLVSGWTRVEPVRTRDAVADETPASRATSASVGGVTGAAETVTIGVTAFSCQNETWCN
jgi:hypothetical protein